VENRGSLDIPFPDIDWELFINANSFIRGNNKFDGSIKARATNIMEVPFSLSYVDFFRTFQSLRGSSNADYKVTLGTNFNLPVIGDKRWQFEHEGEMPVIQVPSISFSGITLKNLSLSRVDFEIAWDIENNNSFAMNVKELSYNFMVNNSQWSTGRIPGSPQIPANRRTVVPMEFSISSLSVVREITEIVTRGTNITYACSGNLNLGTALPGLGDYQTPFNFSGTTRLSR
jgi:LEA14-like dessication related protein